MNRRSDVVSSGAVALLPALDSRWFDTGGASGQLGLVVGLGLVAVVALLVAASAYNRDTRRTRRSGDDDSDIFTTMPVPVGQDELARMHESSNHHAYGSFRLPRWVQLGSILVAAGITYAAAQRIRTDRRTQQGDTARTTEVAASDRDGRDGRDDGSPENVDLNADSAAPFAFRARDWIAIDGGCAGRLEVTRGAASGWNLRARVHDGRGQLIDTAVTRVATLREGDVVEFRFYGTDCDRIGAWDVSGNRR